jgi:sugar (pentulose or hexulose) kinase
LKTPLRNFFVALLIFIYSVKNESDFYKKQGIFSQNFAKKQSFPGAVGVGIVRSGQAMLSIGTSGVYFAVSDGYKAQPDQAIHSFCHAVSNKWHLMSVMLNSASCLDFTARLTGFDNVPAMLEAAEERGLQPNGPLFLPYLTGERTPHNDAHLQGSFTGERTWSFAKLIFFQASAQKPNVPIWQMQH